MYTEKRYTLNDLIKALDSKDIDFEFRDVGIWTGRFDDKGNKICRPSGSYVVSFEYQPFVQVSYKVVPLESEYTEVDLMKEPVFFVERYNQKIGKSIKAMSTGHFILDKVIQ